MSATPERRLRFVDPDAPRAGATDHWRAQNICERLQAVLALHREGNALFKGGNPPVPLEWRLYHDLPR